MPYLLNIRIDGARLSDTDARIVSLLNYDLEYFEIADYLGLEEKTIRNKVCELYGDLEVHGIGGLLRKSHSYGFDFHGHVYSQDLFTADERHLLFKRFPPWQTKSVLHL
jgi:hypothetical protein